MHSSAAKRELFAPVSAPPVEASQQEPAQAIAVHTTLADRLHGD